MTSTVRRLLGCLVFTAACAPSALLAQSGGAAPANKLTIAYYDFSSGTHGVDLNLRHAFATTTGWVGVYHEGDGFDQVRAGFEVDYKHDWLTVVPSLQVASHGFLGGSVYAEAGRRLFAIGGAGATNLKPYWNLGFDPNDYAQGGVGVRDSAGDVASVYAIRDVRLGTGQTNTHVYLRRYFPRQWRVTVDAVNERGTGDDGAPVRGWSVSGDVDWRRWFVRVAADPHVNYTADSQVRVAGGVRF